LDPHSESGKGEINFPAQSISISDVSGSETSSERIKGVRPASSTIINKRKKQEDIAIMKNETAREYKVLVDREKKRGQRMKLGNLIEIINESKQKRNLENVKVSPETIQQRIWRDRVETLGHHNGGHNSPLLAIENTVIGVLLKMAHIRQSLTPSRDISLVNSLINEQPIQQKLIIGRNNTQIMTNALLV